MKIDEIKCDDFKLRLLSENDLKDYYKSGFLESDDEVKYFTGTIKEYTQSDIKNYILKIINDESRIDFLIVNEQNKIIGEVVLSEINDKKCHFRICIFKTESLSKGIGFKICNTLFTYIFNNTKISEIELEVFPFNHRGISLYKKLGFESIDNILDDEAEEPYREIILMKLIKENFIVH